MTLIPHDTTTRDSSGSGEIPDFLPWLGLQVAQSPLSEWAIARGAGISPSQLSRLLKGQVPGGPKSFRPLGAYFGAPQHWIARWNERQQFDKRPAGPVGELLALVLAKLASDGLVAWELDQHTGLDAYHLRDGICPRPVTLARWLTWLGIEDEVEREKWQARIQQEWSARRFASQSKPPIGCRKCGRETTTPPSIARDYDAETRTYLCKGCRYPHVQIRCLRCGASRTAPPYAVKRIRSQRPQVAGQDFISYLCVQCSGHNTSRIARQRFLAKWAVGPSDGPEIRSEVGKEHFSKVVRKAGGRAKVVALSVASRKRGLSEEGKRMVSIWRILRKNRTGKFQLCPLCRKIVYVSPTRVKAGRPGFHGPCAREWSRSPEVCDYRRKLGNTRSPLYQRRVEQYPYPLPPQPRGRRATSEELANRLRWLFRRYLLRQSWSEIAKAEGQLEDTVRRGVEGITRVLPADWHTLFGRYKAGKKLEVLLPMAKIRQS